MRSSCVGITAEGGAGYTVVQGGARRMRGEWVHLEAARAVFCEGGGIE